MSDLLPATRDALPDRPVDAASTAGAAPSAAHHRMLAYGVLAVMVVEDMDVAGYDKPGRFQVTVGGKPVEVYDAQYDQASGRRVILTAIGNVVIPSASQRAAGAQVTVAGMTIPGA